MANKIEILINAKDKFSGAFGKLGSILPGVGKALAAAGTAATAAAAGVIAITKSTAEAYDSVFKFSERIGITTEALSAYHYVAELAGVSQSELNTGFQYMAKNISEASDGIGTAKDALEALGIKVDDIKSKSPDQQFEAIAQAMDSVEDSADRVAYAMDIFGRSGASLLQIMDDGADNMKAMKEEAEKFGLVISTKAGAAAAAFNDSLTRMLGAFKGLKNYMAEQVMPTLTGLANRFSSLIADNRVAIIDFAAKAVQALGKFVEYSAYAVALLVDSWRGLKMIWQLLKIGFASFASYLVEGTKKVVDTISTSFQALNVRGVFDENIESVKAFSSRLSIMNAEIEWFAGKSKEALQDIVDEGTTIGRVNNIVNAMKDAIAEIQAEGVAAANPLSVSDDERQTTVSNIEAMTEAQKAAYEQLLAAHDEYYLSEEERLYEWYLTQQELYAGHQEALATLDEVYQAKADALAVKRAKAKEKKEKDERKKKEKRLRDEANFRINLFRTTEDALYAIQTMIGKKGFETMKKIRIAAAVITGIQAAINAWNAGLSTGGPYAPAIAAAYVVASLAFTAARISAIQSQQYPSAHGGLEYVPNEQTYMLNRGERVLSPRQNEDLTNAIEDGSIGGGGTFNIENFNLSIHVPDADGLISLSSDDWDEIAQERVLPAFRRLAMQGQTI